MKRKQSTYLEVGIRINKTCNFGNFSHENLVNYFHITKIGRNNSKPFQIDFRSKHVELNLQQFSMYY